MKKSIKTISEALNVSESTADKIGVIAADFAIWLTRSMHDESIKGDASISTYTMFEQYIEEIGANIKDFGTLE